MTDAAASHVEIAQLVHRYADAVIHRNGTQWRSTWAPDADWDLGGGRMVQGVDAIADLWYKAMGGFKATIQTVLSGETDIAGDDQTATGRWYIQEHVLRADDSRTILLAHYDDAYRRVDGQWRFARRFLQVHYNGAPDLSEDFHCTADALRARGAEGVDV